jgi:two-component system OmpR family sensor kinase
VSDRGPGFPPELRSRLFARFTRADRARGRGTGGAGLGLALVKAVVDAHGGRVSASSAPGAVVRITLPDA